MDKVVSKTREYIHVECTSKKNEYGYTVFTLFEYNRKVFAIRKQHYAKKGFKDIAESMFLRYETDRRIEGRG